MFLISYVMEEPKKKRVTKENKNGQFIKVRKGNVRTNLPVNLPNDPTWLKQPNLITLMSFDYKNIQMKVLISVIEKIQNAIEESIKGIDYEQTSLFKEMDNSNKIRVEIQYSELGIKSFQYPEVKVALKELASIPVEFDTKHPVTGEDCWAVAGLFRAYIPTKAYNRSFTIEIEKDVAKLLVNTEKGFTKYIKEIAFQTNSKYTVRMYMLISSWKDKGGFSITVDKFRKWLKLDNKYLEYKDLYRWVIKPVYNDLFEKSNCWFEISEIYNKKGDNEPYRLDFKVIKSALSEKEQELLDAQIKQIIHLGTRYLQLQDKHFQELTPLITMSNYVKVLDKISFLIDYLKENYKSINSVPEYCLSILRKELEAEQGIIGD